MFAIGEHIVMVLVQSIDLEGATGRIDLSGQFQPLYYDEIAEGVNRFFTGSTFSVIERVTIRTAIYDPALVDFDSNYFNPKLYLGNYQTIGSAGLPLHRLGDDGFLIDLFQTIEKITYYTVGNPLRTLGQKGDRFMIDPCNFFLRPSAKIILPVPEPIPGFELTNDSPAFIGQITNSSKKLDNFLVSQYFTGVGLFLLPGVQGEEVIYSAQIAGLAPLADDIPDVNSCSLGSVTCRQQFNTFLSKNQGTVFLTLADAQAAYPQQPPEYEFTQVPWICPTNPLEIFQYLIAVPLPTDCNARQAEFIQELRSQGRLSASATDSEATAIAQARAAAEAAPPNVLATFGTTPIPVPGCPPRTSASVFVGFYVLRNASGTVIGGGDI
jgi:hypothetical protein